MNIFMSSPSALTGAFGRLLRCLGAARHLQPFHPRRHHSRLARREVSLLDHVAHGQVRGFGLAGAVGVFMVHALTVVFFGRPGYSTALNTVVTL